MRNGNTVLLLSADRTASSRLCAGARSGCRAWQVVALALVESLMPGGLQLASQTRQFDRSAQAHRPTRAASRLLSVSNPGSSRAEAPSRSKPTASSTSSALRESAITARPRRRGARFRAADGSVPRQRSRSWSLDGSYCGDELGDGVNPADASSLRRIRRATRRVHRTAERNRRATGRIYGTAERNRGAAGGIRRTACGNRWASRGIRRAAARAGCARGCTRTAATSRNRWTASSARSRRALPGRGAQSTLHRFRSPLIVAAAHREADHRDKDD
jgi:hypothetical protein